MVGDAELCLTFSLNAAGLLHAEFAFVWTFFHSLFKPTFFV